MYAYCLNNPVCLYDSNGAFARNTYDLQQAGVGNTGAESSNPKNTPPNHPGYKPPKKGNRKAKNPNGEGKGWLDAKGNVWIWDPEMHGGAGWVIQEPGGGHKHAYPGGGVRIHRVDVTLSQEPNIPFPAMPQENLIISYPALQQGSISTTFPQINSGLVIMTVAGSAVFAFLASYLGGIEWL